MELGTDNPIVKAVAEHFFGNARSLWRIALDRAALDFMDDGSVFYELDGKRIHAFHSEARFADGTEISTRSAKRDGFQTEKTSGGLAVTAVYHRAAATLTQSFLLKDGSPWITVSVTLSRRGKKTETNYLAPVDFIYPNAQCAPLFLSLDQKLLLVPYDNDMWVRWESAPLRPGRTSCDVTAIYDERSLNGIVVGALDFDVWKNAIRCSEYDARCYTAFSGYAGPLTHDCMPHGSLIGDEVRSARFALGWFPDIRDGLEAYGRMAAEGQPDLPWSGGVPFGWNSYSALAIGLTPEHLGAVSDFLREELPSFRGEDGSVFINMDAAFGLSEKKLSALREKCGEAGQKCGTYLAPAGYMSLLDLLPLKGSPLKARKNTVMKKPDGTSYRKIDSSVPVDITRPEVEKDLRLSLRELAAKGYSYLKVDFTSHASVEGTRYDPAVRTGRQALSRFYAILREELDPSKTGRETFLSLSIAPLFPGGSGHARRCCCDAFGHAEDVRYILNALNFGWWTSGTLYRFADPDHTVLYRSAVDERPVSTVEEARSRYNASVISGTVLLLSDNYGPKGEPAELDAARARAKQLANCPEINALARLGKPFRPAYLRDGTCSIYYLHHGGRHYAALFNFEPREAEVSVPAETIGMKRAGTVTDLRTGETREYRDTVACTLKPYDSVIFEIKEE